MPQSPTAPPALPTSPPRPFGTRQKLNIARATPSTRNDIDRDSVDLKGLKSILAANIGTILTTALLPILLALAYLAVATPKYTSTVGVFVDPRAKRTVENEVVQPGLGSDLALIESQVKIMGSDAVLLRVVKSEKLVADPEFNGSLKGIRDKISEVFISVKKADAPTEAGALRLLREAVKVTRARKTYVIEAKVTSRSASKAARLAQAIGEAYLKDQSGAKVNNTAEANRLLDSRLDELRSRVKAAETKVQAYRKTKNILTAGGSLVNESELNKLNTDIIDARARNDEAQQRLIRVQAIQRSGGSLDSSAEAIASGTIQRLRAQLAAANRQASAIGATLLPNHPDVRSARSQVQAIQRQINAELSRIARTAKSEAQITAGRVTSLEKKLAESKTKANTLNQDQIALRELEREAQSSRAVLNAFLARAKETQQQQKLYQPDARIISPAAVPAKPSKPRKWLILALATLGGLGLGVSRAFLKADQDTDQLTTANDITQQLGLASIAKIPRIEKPTRNLNNLFGLRRDTSRVNPATFYEQVGQLIDPGTRARSPFPQSILKLLNELQDNASNDNRKTVLITSADEREGKTSIALSLAWAGAIVGDNVLLIDADSDNPELSRIFSSENINTRTAIIEDKTALAKFLKRDKNTGLSFLPLAAMDIGTMNASRRRAFTSSLASLLEDYALVIIDGGSAADGNPARLLINLSDSTLFVIRAGNRTTDETASAIETLQIPTEKMAGVVLSMTTDTKRRR